MFFTKFLARCKLNKERKRILKSVIDVLENTNFEDWKNEMNHWFTSPDGKLKIVTFDNHYLARLAGFERIFTWSQERKLMKALNKAKQSMKDKLELEEIQRLTEKLKSVN